MSISSALIKTDRLEINTLFSGPDSGIPILFIHGNASSSLFWKELMTLMPDEYRCIAPDLRGYGDTEDLLIDATRGLNDFTDDLLSLLKALDINRYYIIGHSLGGSIGLLLTAVDSARIENVTLVNPGSPFGFGGTKGLDGQPCWPDYAGSGGGVVNPAFAQFIGKKYRGSEDPLASPRVVMNNFYWKPPFVPAQEEELLDSLLSEKVGPDRYPGDLTASENYPFVAPGKLGPANAMSPKYVGNSVEKLINCKSKPPILWVRGSDDQIVSDQSLFCLGTLGKLGIIPGYPGEEIYPPQPMVSQTRSVLEQYQNNGGLYKEVVMDNTGHSPFIEQPHVFLTHFLNIL